MDCLCLSWFLDLLFGKFGGGGGIGGWTRLELRVLFFFFFPSIPDMYLSGVRLLQEVCMRCGHVQDCFLQIEKSFTIKLLFGKHSGVFASHFCDV